MVSGTQTRLVRRRETVAALWQGETTFGEAEE
jgi:hypothetical protein